MKIINIFTSVSLFFIFLLSACAAESDAASTPIEAAPPFPTPSEAKPGEPLFPDILKADLTEQGDGTYSISVTVSSPYDTPQHYADAWRILAPDGTVLGERVLAHDHANEQPFTRSLSGLVIPDNISKVTIQGRDKINGYGGKTLEISVPGRE